MHNSAMHDDPMMPERGAVIDGRAAFTRALQRSLGYALRQRERELCLVDPDFETWPLDDAVVLDTLNAWARLPQRRLLMVAVRYDAVARHFSRFATWRGTFAHVVEAFVTASGADAGARGFSQPDAGRPSALARSCTDR